METPRKKRLLLTPNGIVEATKMPAVKLCVII
jgi:hypothetical protein